VRANETAEVPWCRWPLTGTYSLELSEAQTQEKESAFQQTDWPSRKGAAEGSLTSWSRREFSRRSEKWGVRHQTSKSAKKEGQLSGHLLPDQESSKVQPKSDESGTEQARSSTRGTAERALTRWSYRKISPTKGPKMWDKGTAGKVRANGIARRDSLCSN
jgi:hypothetical protein